jgi:hypothetical protein
VIKALVKNGVVVPCDPLPTDWQEGTEVEVERLLPPPMQEEEIDRWLADLEAIASQGDPEDDRRLDEVLAENRRFQKELARKKAGLP